MMSIKLNANRRIFLLAFMLLPAAFVFFACGGDDNQISDGDTDGDADQDRLQIQSCDDELQAPEAKYGYLGVMNFTIEGEDTKVQIARQPGNEMAAGMTTASLVFVLIAVVGPVRVTMSGKTISRSGRR